MKFYNSLNFKKLFGLLIILSLSIPCIAQDDEEFDESEIDTSITQPQEESEKAVQFDHDESDEINKLLLEEEAAIKKSGNTEDEAIAIDVGIDLMIPIIGDIVMRQQSPGKSKFSAEITNILKEIILESLEFDSGDAEADSNKITIDIKGKIFGKRVSIKLIDFKRARKFLVEEKNEDEEAKNKQTKKASSTTKKDSQSSKNKKSKLKKMVMPLEMAKFRVRFLDKTTITLYPGKKINISYADLIFEKEKPVTLSVPSIILKRPVNLLFMFNKSSFGLGFSLEEITLGNLLNQLKNTPFQNVLIKKAQFETLTTKNPTTKKREAHCNISARADFSALSINKNLNIALSNTTLKASISRADGFSFEAGIEDAKLPIVGKIEEAKFIFEQKFKKGEKPSLKLTGKGVVPIPEIKLAYMLDAGYSGNGFELIGKILLDEFSFRNVKIKKAIIKIISEDKIVEIKGKTDVSGKEVTATIRLSPDPSDDSKFAITFDVGVKLDTLKPFEKTKIPKFKDLELTDVRIGVSITKGKALSGASYFIGKTKILGIDLEATARIATGAYGEVVLLKADLPSKWKISDSVPALKNTFFSDLEFSKASFIISTNTHQDSELDIDVRQGLTLYATMSGEAKIFKPLLKIFGLKGADLTFYGTISADPSEIVLGAKITDSIPKKSARFAFGPFSMELKGFPPSIAVEGTAIVRPSDKDELNFGLETEFNPAASELAFSGYLQGGGSKGESSEWKNPFGIPGLTIGHVGIKVGIDSVTLATGIPSPLGVTGSIGVGSRPITMSLMMDAELKDMACHGQTPYLTLYDMVIGLAAGPMLSVAAMGIAAAGAIPKEAIPPITLNDVEVRFAAKDVSIPPIIIPKGITLKGELRLFNAQAAKVDIAIDPTLGVIGRGSMANFDIGLLKVTGAEKGKGPQIDIELTAKAQHVKVNGYLELIGMKHGGEIDITNKGIRFQVQENLGGFMETILSGQAPFNISDPDFMVSILIRTSKLYQIVKDAVRGALNKIPGIREVGDLVINPVLDAFDLRKLEGSFRLKDLIKIKTPTLSVDAVLFGQSIDFSIQGDLSNPNKIKDFVVDGVLVKIKDAIWNLIKDPLMAVKLLGEKAARELVNAAETIGKGLQKGAEEIRDVAKKSAEKLKDIGAAGIQVAKDVGEKGIDTAKVAGQQTAAVAKTAGIFVGDNVTRGAKEVASGVENASKAAIGGIQTAANALKNAFEDLGNALKDAAEAVLGAIGIDTGAKERRKREAEERVRKQIEGLIAQSNDYIAKVLNPLDKMALEEQNAAATIRNQVQEYYSYVPPAIKDNEYKSKVMGYLSLVNSVKQSVEEMKKQVENGNNQIRNTINPTIDSIVKAIPKDIPDSVLSTVNKLNEIIVQMRQKSAVIANIFNQTAGVLHTITNEPNGGNINKFIPNILNLSEMEALRLAASLSSFYLSKLNELNNKATELFNRIRDNRNAIEGEKNSSSSLMGIIFKSMKMSDLQNKLKQDIDTFNQILPAATFIHDLAVKMKQDYIWIVLKKPASVPLTAEESKLVEQIGHDKAVGDNYYGKIAYAADDQIIKQPLMTPQQLIDAAMYTYKNAKQIEQTKEASKQAQEASKREFERQQLIMKQTPTSLFESDNSYMRITNQYGNFNDVDMGVIYNKFNKVGALEEFNKVIKDLALAMSNSGGRSTANLNNFDFAKELIMTKAISFNDLRNVAKKFKVEIPESSLDPIANLVASKLKYLNDRSKELVREMPADKAVLYMDVGKLFASNPTKKNIIISDFRTRLGSRLGFTPNDNQLEQCLIQKTTVNNNSPLNSIFSDFWRWDEPKKQIIYNEATNALKQIVNMFPYELQTQNIYLPNPASISADASYNLIKKSYPTLESINPSALFYTTGYITPEWKSAIEKMLVNLKPLITNFDFAHRLVLNKAITFDKVKEIARQYGNPAFSNIELDFICNQVSDTIIKLDQIYKNLKQAAPQAPVAVATSSDSSFNNIKKKHPSVVNIDPVGVYNMFGYITNPWRNEINKLNDSLKQVNINNFDFVNKLVLSKAITFDKVKEVAKQFGNPHFSDSQLDFICNQVADTIVRLDQVYQELALG